MNDSPSPPLFPADAAPTLPPTTPGQEGSETAPVQVPGYEILEELGRGGMGVVYKARQIRLNRLVALKMILAGGHAGEEALARFRAEAEAVARLQHPGIVQIHEVGEHEGRPFFSLEFCAGGSLEKQLNGTPLPPREAAQYIETLARAMHHAHQQGIVHRDLKPANVLLAACGLASGAPAKPQAVNTVPKITDFGLAKQLDRERGQTRSGAVLGTPSYMAPEQAGGRSREIGPATDIYALGAILYEMLTGRPPFKAETPLDTVLLVLSEEPVPPRRLQPKVPGDLETICLKCLEKDPAKRYATANNLAEDLQRFQSGEPIKARPIGLPARGWRWCKRKPAVATSIVLLIALILGVLLEMHDAAGRELRLRKLAEEHAAEVLQRLHEAEKATQEAKVAQEKVEQANQALLEEKKQREAGAYVSNIHLANSEWQAGNHVRHRQALDACPPVLRGWEWNFVNRFSQSELLSFQESQNARLRGLTYRPDGKHLATASLDGKVRIWEAATGKLLRTFTLYPGKVPIPENNMMFYGVAYSPDGQRVAAGADKHAAQVLDAESGQVLQTLSGHKGVVLGVAFSPDGKRLASCSTDRTVRVWPLTGEKGALVLRGHENLANSVAFSPDGKKLASASLDGSVRLWDPAMGRLLHTYRGHTNGAFGVAFSPDGRRLASTGGWEALVRVWDASTGHELQKLAGHTGFVLGVAFSPDGRRLASTGSHQNVRVWDVATWQEVHRFWGHDRVVAVASFSPDGRSLATGDWHGGVKVWDLTRGADYVTLRGPGGTVAAVAFSPDGRRLAVATDREKTVPLYLLDTGAEERALRHPQPVAGVAFSPDGQLVATASNRLVHLWDPASGKEARQLKGHLGQVQRVAFSPDGKWLVSGGQDRTVRVWNVATGEAMQALKELKDRVTSLCFHPHRNRLVATAADGTMCIWDTTTWKQEGSGSGFGWINQGAVSPDGRLLAFASGNNQVEVIDWDTSKKVFTFWPHSYGSRALAFSRDSRRLVTAGGDGFVKVWDITGAREQELLTLRGHTSALSSAVFSPDGQHLATASEDGVVRLWNAEALTPEQRRASQARRALAWDRLEADAAERAHQSFAWRFHLDTLVRERPNDGGPRRDRAEALAELGEYQEAAKDAELALKLLPDDMGAQILHGLLPLALGDLATYRTACAQMLLFRGKDPQQGVMVAGFCGLAPDALPNQAPLLAIVRKAVASRPDSLLNQWVLGLTLYRARLYGEAIEQLQKVVELHGEEYAVWDWLILAMANHRLGRTAEARTWLAKVIQWADRSPPDAVLGIPEMSVPAWATRVAFQVLRREAETMIREGN